MEKLYLAIYSIGYAIYSIGYAIYSIGYAIYSIGYAVANSHIDYNYSLSEFVH